MVKRKKRLKKISLTEFSAWLEGVEELQPDGWFPNAEQWILIREKIKSIKEEPKVVEIAPQPNYTNPRQINPSQPQHVAALPNIPPAPPVGGFMTDVEMTPAARQMLNGGDNSTSRTPDIDTSDGNVTSTFA